MGVAFSRANFIRAAVAVAGVKGEGGIKESEVALPRLPSAAFSFLEATARHQIADHDGMAMAAVGMAPLLFINNANLMVVSFGLHDRQRTSLAR